MVKKTDLISFYSISNYVSHDVVTNVGHQENINQNVFSIKMFAEMALVYILIKILGGSGRLNVLSIVVLLELVFCAVSPTVY